MNFKLGDYVTRQSYNNDLVFQIIDIDDDIAYLRGVDVRLYADSELDDLNKVSVKKETDRIDIEKVESLISLDRNEYFYLPGKIVQFDSDKFYLDRCINFYKDMHLEAYGIKVKESEIEDVITDTLEKYKPDIVVITGHDFLKKHAKDKSKIENYQNSENFVNAIKKARMYEKNQDKLIIIAGACQSNYEELIKAGSNFASSPKRINIHALDPAIVASCVALSPVNKAIDLIPLIDKTHYGSAGMGGIITNGTMYVGYPR
ncbi:MAG: sporulation peptidase YabG [bacterium]|jgi:yabG peptidase U57|nr:sporulation peptidase YabG [bacterium]